MEGRGHLEVPGQSSEMSMFAAGPPRGQEVRACGRAGVRVSGRGAAAWVAGDMRAQQQQHAAVGVDGVVGVGWLVGQLCDVGSGSGESWAWGTRGHENGRWAGLGHGGGEERGERRVTCHATIP
jgi:hypothetical protein